MQAWRKVKRTVKIFFLKSINKMIIQREKVFLWFVSSRWRDATKVRLKKRVKKKRDKLQREESLLNNVTAE